MKLADVIVDRPTWMLDRPLSYILPEEISEDASVGSIVRVPLRSKRVRGWIIALREGDPPPNAQEVAALSGRGPVFDDLLLAAMRELSETYIKPLALMCRAVTPPRVGRRSKKSPHSVASDTKGARKELWVRAPSEDPVDRYSDEIEAAAKRGLGAIVAVPEVRQHSAILDELGKRFSPDAVVIDSSSEPKERSDGLWSLVYGESKVALGGRAAVMAPAFPLGVIIVHDEHDRSMKDQRSPYLDAGTAALVRGAHCGADVLLSSKTPRLTTLRPFEGEGEVTKPSRDVARKGWPRVELVEPARRGVPRRAVALVLEVFRQEGKSMVLLPRLTETKAGWGPQQVIDYLERVVPGASVSWIEAKTLQKDSLSAELEADVVIGTEAMLGEVARPQFDAGIVLGADAYVSRTTGYGTERACQELWEMASILTSSDRQARMLIETRTPEHHLFQSLTRGDHSYFVGRESEEREAGGWPPFTHLIKVSASPSSWPNIEDRLRLKGVKVLGPSTSGDRYEALLKVSDPSRTRKELRDSMDRAPSDLIIEVEPRDW